MKLRAGCLLCLGLLGCSEDDDLAPVAVVPSPPTFADAQPFDAAPVDAPQPTDVAADVGPAFGPGATVAAGNGSTCWREGTDAVWCRSRTPEPALAFRAPSEVVDLAMLDVNDPQGFTLACAVTSAGALHCWSVSAAATRIETPGRVARVALGRSYGCLLLEAGQVWCARERLTELSRVPGLGPARSVAVGVGAACAALSDGSVHCWGERLPPLIAQGADASWQIEMNAPTPVRIPLPPARSVMLGRHPERDAYFACALHEGDQASCWGWGAQNVDVNTTNRDNNLRALLAGGVRQIAVGNDINLFTHLTVWVLGTDGNLRCTGYGGCDSVIPDPMTAIAEIAAGTNATCIRKQDGTTVWCR